MSKLFNLKEWLTVPEAAKYLSIAFGEDVSEADVLRLGLDGHLKLSVDFVNGAVARGGQKVPLNEAKTAKSLDGLGNVVLGIFLPPDQVLELHDGLVAIRGVWDLPMCWAERLDIENRYQTLTGGPEITSHVIDGLFVEDASGNMFNLQADWADCEKYKERANGKGYLDPDRYYPAAELPLDAVLVIRTEAIREFEMALSGKTTCLEKPLKTKEKTSLLTIIALLAEEAKIDWRQPTKAATNIVHQADRLGVQIGQRTIEEYLKQIPDALERRMKPDA